MSLVALLFGLGILRLRGAYFALATIGVNEGVKAFVSNFAPWGGSSGIYLSIDAINRWAARCRRLWTSTSCWSR